ISLHDALPICPVRQVRSQFKMVTSRRQRRLRMDPNLRPRNPDQKTDRNPLERKSKMKVWRGPARPRKLVWGGHTCPTFLILIWGKAVKACPDRVEGGDRTQPMASPV